MPLFDADPAIYSPASTKDHESVFTLQSILDINRVKPQIKTMDSTPNYDGFLDLVDENGIPIDKLEVQVKTLDDKIIDSPKYQCEISFLSYCANYNHTSIPILLILVNKKHEIAYWHHMDITTLTALAEKLKPGAASVTLSFDKENIIKKNVTDYIQKWIEILQSHKNLVQNAQDTQSKYEDLMNIHKEVSARTNIAVGKLDPKFVNIQIFINNFNYLLDGDFKIIKSINYPSIWQIGIGINSYNDDSLNYGFYPIPYGFNDVLIKEFQKDDIPNPRFLMYKGMYGNNLIKSKPIEYSAQLMTNLAIDTMHKTLPIIKNPIIAFEYVIAFINANIHILILDKKNEYTICEIERSLMFNIHLFAEIAAKYCPIINETKLLEVTHLPYLLQDNLRLVYMETQLAIATGVTTSNQYNIRFKEFDINIVFQLLQYLKSKQIDKISITDLPIKKKHYAPYTQESEIELILTINSLFEILPTLYDDVVKEFFPTFFDSLKFFNTHNLVIITIDFSRSQYTHLPSIHIYKLKTTSISSCSLKVYNAKDLNITIENILDKYLNIDGITYEIIDNIAINAAFITSSIPLIECIQSLLIRELKLYLENKYPKI